MSNITVQVSLNVDRIIDKLSPKARIELVKKLQRDSYAKKLDKLLSKIDKRCQKYPVTENEIAALVEETRRELYGKSGS